MGSAVVSLSSEALAKEETAAVGVPLTASSVPRPRRIWTGLGTGTRTVAPDWEMNSLLRLLRPWCGLKPPRENFPFY
jgi:hypothetical protein